MGPEESNIGRRDFLQMAGVGIVAASAGATATQSLASNPSANSESSAGIVPQPSPEFAPELTTADIMVETLISWGATHCFGVVGDGINSIIEALRKRQDRIKYIGVRHEEAAAFMASGFAKHTGQLGVCVGTTGPGAVHLLNGLYDAHMDGAPVVAITGMTFHDLIGTRYQQGIDTTKLMQDVALYNVEVTGPEHAVLVTNRACRVALGDRGVAHLTVSKDTQMMRLAADKRSMGNPGARTSSSWTPVVNQPPADQLRAAADVLNSGRKVAILVGQGALNARAEVTEVADLLGAPVAKALLGKAVLADDSPFTTGGIGHLGTAPSSWAMKNCDTVFIIGSTMPWFEYYPKPGQARGVQIDMKPDRIGLRYPVEIGLVGDAKATLAALIPLLQRQSDRSFLQEAQSRMADWNRLLGRGRSDLRVASAAADGDQSRQRSDRGRRRDFARLRREHSLRRTQSDVAAGPATDRHGHDGFDGARPPVRHCRPARLPGSPIGGDRWRRRVCNADGGDDNRRPAQAAGQDHRSQEQQPRRGQVRAGRARQSFIRMRSLADRLRRLRPRLRRRRVSLRAARGDTAGDSGGAPFAKASAGRGHRRPQREASKSGRTARLASAQTQTDGSA